MYGLKTLNSLSLSLSRCHHRCTCRLSSLLSALGQIGHGDTYIDTYHTHIHTALALLKPFRLGQVGSYDSDEPIHHTFNPHPSTQNQDLLIGHRASMLILTPQSVQKPCLFEPCGIIISSLHVSLFIVVEVDIGVVRNSGLKFGALDCQYHVSSFPSQKQKNKTMMHNSDTLYFPYRVCHGHPSIHCYRQYSFPPSSFVPPSSF